MQKKVQKRLFHLYTGELAATVMFAFVWLYYLQRFEWAALSFSTGYAFVLLEFILLQGSYYWFLKHQQVKRGTISLLPARKLRLFRALKYSNTVLIGIGGIVLIVELMSFKPSFYFFLFLYVFAIGEHINYYYIRLSYQTKEEIEDWLNNKKLRRSRLSRELKSLS